MTFLPDILIYGLGRSGRGVARFLAREGLRAHWWDARPSEEDLALTARLGFERGDPTGIYTTVIAAPGVPIDLPDLARLREHGAEVIGEAELAYRSRSTPIIGVTGTAGKGGTSSLIAQLLVSLGVNARLGGNFDPPLLDIIDEAEVAVAELSSFQLERARDFRPCVAVVTNLGVDHLDRHRTLAAYHAAKVNITAAQGKDDVLLLPSGLELPTKARVLHFDGATIITLGGETVLSPDQLPEGHHPANAAAAVLAVESYLARGGRNVKADDLREALLQAQPVPGRFQTVARRGDLRFVEDSIATRTLAVKAALERATAPVAWLVGGRDKGADLADLAELVREKVAFVIAFGEDGPAFAAHFDKPTTVIEARDGEQAMREAVRAAAQLLGDAGTVLLAPIGTSFDLYTDYKARGEAFTRAALELSREVPA